MKTNSMTLSQTPGQSLHAAAAAWLSTQNSFATAMMGCNFSNLQFYGLLLSGFFLAFAILSACLSFSSWGWVAFFALSAIVSAVPGIRAINHISE